MLGVLILPTGRGGRAASPGSACSILVSNT